jgi:hypothetical protein
MTFSGRDDSQSGQRLLGSSDPRLRRHVASCEAAGGDITFLPAGKDEKLPREFEGGALIGREAHVPSLLDSLTNNRHLEQQPNLCRSDDLRAPLSSGYNAKTKANKL